MRRDVGCLLGVPLYALKGQTHILQVIRVMTNCNRNQWQTYPGVGWIAFAFYTAFL